MQVCTESSPCGAGLEQEGSSGRNDLGDYVEQCCRARAVVLNIGKTAPSGQLLYQDVLELVAIVDLMYKRIANENNGYVQISRKTANQAHEATNAEEYIFYYKRGVIVTFILAVEHVIVGDRIVEVVRQQACRIFDSLKNTILSCC